jgi:hypothetical protein
MTTPKPVPRTFAPDDAKMKELMLFVARKSEADPHFGATKLNKILFYSDFLSYAQRGAPITGQTYFRLGMGPAPRRLLPLRRDLIEVTHEAAMQFRKVGTASRPQERLVALREPKLSAFTGEEVALVESVIEMLRDKDGQDCSDLTHELPCWKAFGDREDIPYQTAFFATRTLTEDEVAFGQQLAAAK